MSKSAISFHLAANLAIASALMTWDPPNVAAGFKQKFCYQRSAFTLVELLAVTGIIGVVVGMLIPTVAKANAASRFLVCQSNVRQIALGLYEYAASNKGFFPPNVGTRYWYDYDRMGRILTPMQSDVRGTVAICPEDTGALRSYAMNVWASSQIDAQYKNNGTLWKQGCRYSSRMLLISEKWSSTGSLATGFLSLATIGSAGVAPGQRFGASPGVNFQTNRFGISPSELCYARHRLPTRLGTGAQAIGRLSIAYADGHVEGRSHGDLYVATSGLSQLDTLWSAQDYSSNHWP